MNELHEFRSALKTVVNILQRFNSPYAVIGGVAIIVRGYDRSTTDLDIIALDIDEPLEALLQALHDAGFTLRHDYGERFVRQTRLIPITNGAESIDIAMGAMRPEINAVENATAEDFGEGTAFRVATVHDLLILKLFAQRQKDLVDAHELLLLYPDVDRQTILGAVQALADELEEPERGDVARRVLGLE